ncbi:nucleoside-diphosphate kinase [bacterium]|nr:nucleoside-diphosphate kinase [bacterium]
MERTFIAVKPDGVKRGLVGNIVERFERKGYKIIAMKMLQPTIEIAAKHYAEHVGKPFYNRLINYITSGPIVAMVVEGNNVVKGARHIMGSTKPDEAEVGTIRADFAQTMEYNVVHGSDSVESAEREIAIYFKPEEICRDWKTTLDIIMENEK